MEQSKIDWPSFATCVAIIAAEFGVFYLLASVGAGLMSVSLVKSLQADHPG